MIDWTRVQRALTRAGCPCGKADGDDGPLTYAALWAYDAQRPVDAVIRAVGAAAAKWIKGDPISDTPQRLAEFVAQTGNETGGCARFEENLSYSAAAIAKAWPTRPEAVRYAHQPVALANSVYGGRMGNTQPGDGWRYRGRGMLQLTGRANYLRYVLVTGLPLEDHPELAADPADSLLIAREYWRLGRVNAAIDRGDYAEARRITNGGSIGLEAVAKRRERLLAVLV